MKKVRFTVRFSNEEKDVLEKISNNNGLSIIDYIKQSIS
jgi:hypothetical protein